MTKHWRLGKTCQTSFWISCVAGKRNNSKVKGDIRNKHFQWVNNYNDKTIAAYGSCYSSDVIKCLVPQKPPTLLARKQVLSLKQKTQGWKGEFFFTSCPFHSKDLCYPFGAISVQILDVGYLPIAVFASNFSTLAFKHCSITRSYFWNSLNLHLHIVFFQGPPGLRGEQGEKGAQGVKVCVRFFKYSANPAQILIEQQNNQLPW